MIDAPAREARKAHETQEEIKRQAYAEIGKARFAIEGTSNYPDATFTLRLSYGKVLGYEEDGKQIRLLRISLDSISALPNTITCRPRSAQVWVERKAQLNLATKFNFVPMLTLLAATAAVRWSTRRTNSLA